MSTSEHGVEAEEAAIDAVEEQLPGDDQPPRTPVPRGHRYDRLGHVRRALARLVRETERWSPADLRPTDRIARARCLGALMTSLADVMKADALEARVEKIEQSLRAGQH